MEAKLIKTVTDNYILVDATKEFHGEGYLLGTTTVSDAPRLSLKNCQAIELGYDLDELAKECAETAHTMDELYENGLFYGFMSGFQKALEILGDKKFSDIDVKRAMRMIFDWSEGEDDHSECTSLNELWDKYFESTQQTEWDVEIIEEEPLVAKARQIHGEYVASKLIESAIFPKPLLDADGRLILKRK